MQCEEGAGPRRTRATALRFFTEPGRHLLSRAPTLSRFYARGARGAISRSDWMDLFLAIIRRRGGSVSERGDNKTSSLPRRLPSLFPSILSTPQGFFLPPFSLSRDIHPSFVFLSFALSRRAAPQAT